MRRNANKKPCESFDPSEKQMGRCKACGFSLAEHLRPEGEESDEAAAARAAEEEEEQKDANKARAPPPVLPKRACKNFTLVLNTKSTSMCVCGFEKDQHKGAPKRLSFMMLKKTLTRKNKAGKELPEEPCGQYKVDLESDHYGLCSCGFNKLDHEKAAERKRLEADGKAKTAQVAPKKKPTHPCADFALDLTNAGGYGACKHCGFNRAQHQDFHHKPEEWDDVKGHLKEPKPYE